MKLPEIIFQNKDLAVLSKPAGIVVNEAESVKDEVTVMSFVRQNLLPEVDKWEGTFGEIKIMKERWGVCHRLDKETSGCLLIALRPKILIELMGLFAKREVAKEYLALVHGLMTPSKGGVNLPIGRSQFDRHKFQVHYEGKRAMTEWEVEKQFPSENLSLVRLKPHTGRTHQIRVHLSHLGYPIFADSKYLNKNLMNQDRLRINHHVLHAAKISFKYEGGQIDVDCPLPEEVSRLISCL